MPQLDRFAYVSQVIWLVVVFLVLYFFFLYTGFPRLYKILKFRKDKIELLKNSIVDLERELFFLNKFSRSFLLNFVKGRKSNVEDTMKVTDKILEDSKNSLKKEFDTSRELFTISFDSSFVSKNLKLGYLVDNVSYIKDRQNLKKKL